MKKEAEKINIFFELSSEAFESDNESVYEDMGVSKEDYLNEKLKMVKRLKLNSKAQLNKAKNENLLETAIQKVQKIIESTNESIKEELKNIILSRSPQFQFRNIEKLDKEDLKELLSDLDIINIIENLENTGNKDE